MTLLVRDEDDVLAANLAYHLDQGVDFFVITDHRSTDATPDIIRQFELAGLAHSIRETSEAFDQARWVTRMARLAATECDADWVINNDADEFWWPMSGDLRSTFIELDEHSDVVIAPRHDFVALADDTWLPAEPFHRSMVYRKTLSRNLAGHRLPPKAAHRAHPAAVVAPGNHGVELPGEERRCHGGVEVLHFPFRTREQFVTKTVVGAQATELNTELEPWVSSVRRDLYGQYLDDGLEAYCHDAMHTADDLAAGLADGSLVVDRRLTDHLDAMARQVVPPPHEPASLT